MSLTSTGRIDVHSHLLPGVDDGCESLDESLRCAEMLVAAGYTHSFCTPHVWPNLVDVTIENVTDWTQELQAELDTAGITLKLIPGGELNLRADLPDTMQPDRLITLGMRRKFVLFDIWAERLPSLTSRPPAIARAKPGPRTSAAGRPSAG